MQRRANYCQMATIGSKGSLTPRMPVPRRRLASTPSVAIPRSYILLPVIECGGREVEQMQVAAAFEVLPVPPPQMSSRGMEVPVTTSGHPTVQGESSRWPEGPCSSALGGVLALYSVHILSISPIILTRSCPVLAGH